MRTGTIQTWADNLGVEPDEVLSQVRGFLRAIDGVDERVLRLRITLHRSPDRALDDALRQLEQRVRIVSELLKDLQASVIRELS